MAMWCGGERGEGKWGKCWLCWFRLAQEKRGGVRGANRKAICLTVSRAEILRWGEVERWGRWSGKGVGGGVDDNQKGVCAYVIKWKGGVYHDGGRRESIGARWEESRPGEGGGDGGEVMERGR